KSTVLKIIAGEGQRHVVSSRRGKKSVCCSNVHSANILYSSAYTLVSADFLVSSSTLQEFSACGGLKYSLVLTDYCCVQRWGGVGSVSWLTSTAGSVQQQYAQHFHRLLLRRLTAA
ncbi:unnamed protein product, partial [Ectocarpus sp. 8 AP-2014]